MWLIPFIMNKSAAAALTAHHSLKSILSHGRDKEGMLTSYIQVLNHLLETYETYFIIAQSDT